MSELIGPNGKPIRSPLHRGKDLATKDEVLNVVMYWLGPVTAALTELMDRQKALEDFCGFTYIPSAPQAPAQQGDSVATATTPDLDENR